MQVRTFVPSLYDKNTTVNAIVSGLGEPFLERLQRHFGGQEIRAPKPGHLTPDHPIAQAIGMEDAEALSGVLGGETFYIPRGWRDQPRLGDVAREARAGECNSAIASKLGISARHVRRLKQRLAELQASPGALIAVE